MICGEFRLSEGAPGTGLDSTIFGASVEVMDIVASLIQPARKSEHDSTMIVLSLENALKHFRMPIILLTSCALIVLLFLPVMKRYVIV